jgi:hypothetical protein
MKDFTILILLFVLFIPKINGQKKTISYDSISVYFDEIKAASGKNIELWGKDVYGPMILIDPQSREFFTNESDKAEIFPANMNIANTALDWKGKKWAMIMLPLPQNKYDRIGLLAHESFHRIQPALGFELNNVENNHLDQREGRIYLRLELEALKKGAESTSEKEQQKHLVNALIFRKYRHGLYGGSAVSENLLELNEGIAEYTGLIISGRNKTQAASFLTNGIDDFFKNATFVRSFAYHTIPVYGYSLYNKDKNWNKKITAKMDLTDYFIKAFNIHIPVNLNDAVKKISDQYKGKTIIEEETKREEKIKRLIAEYKLKFIEHPHFEIKFEKMNISFDPRNIVPIENQGTVYPNIRVTDKWGILTVENGALMSSNWDKISISLPVKTEGKKISGDGWTLELTDEYIIKKDDSNGNYKLVRK